MFFSDASISIRDLRKLSRGKDFCQNILSLIWEGKDPENNFKISTPNMASSSSNEFLKLLWKKLDSWMIIICHFSLICICIITSGASRFHKEQTLCMLTSESKISTPRCKSCFPPWQNFQIFQILLICFGNSLMQFYPGLLVESEAWVWNKRVLRNYGQDVWNLTILATNYWQPFLYHL